MTAGGCLGRSFPTRLWQAGAALPLGGSFQTPLYHLHPCRRASLQASLSLERLCRYLSRPAVSEKRMALTPNGKIRYPPKAPCRDGTTHVLFEPQDFTARLASLAPELRVHLTRCHCVFAPNSKHRIQVTPGQRGKEEGKLKLPPTTGWKRGPKSGIGLLRGCSD